MKNIPKVSVYRVFKNRKAIFKNPLPFHHENFNRLGAIFKVKLGRSAAILFARSPEHIKQVLQTNHKKYHKSTLQTKDLAKYIGKGLLTSNGEHWRAHRRMIQPAFHKKKLEGLIGIMDTAICKELDRIQSKESQDVYPLMGDLAFQVVAQSLFSRDDIKDEMAELKKITESNQMMLIREMRQPYLNWWYKLSGAIKHHLNYSKEARKILNEIIEERINSNTDKDDLLDMLLKARYEDGTAMSRDQLIDEVLILFTAGHETTANALSFTLFLLAKNQEAQEKAYESASKVDLDNENHFENLAALSYVKQSLEEGMRLYPPAYYIDRMTIEEDELGGHTIPKNTMILLAVYELHRDVDFWKSPEEFQPERFDPKHKKDFSNYYYPFGAGPRMCVGNNFAMYEMILVVARILKKFKIQSLTDNVELIPLVSLRPKEVMLKFIPR
jgi:cytochrome P450